MSDAAIPPALRMCINLIAPGILGGALIALSIIVHGDNSARRDAGLILIYAITTGPIIGFAFTIPHTIRMEMRHRRGLLKTTGDTIAAYAFSGFLWPWVWALGLSLYSLPFGRSTDIGDLAGLALALSLAGAVTGAITGAFMSLFIEKTATAHEN